MDADRLAARLFDNIDGIVGVDDIAHRDLCAFGCKHLGVFHTYAAARSGDDGNLSVESSHVFLP
jgi:hypothetical protein